MHGDVERNDEEEDDDYESFFDPELFVDKSYSQRPVRAGHIEVELYALHDAASTDHDLTGQIVWPAAKSLALYLQEQKEKIQSCRVLEVGAGIGLSGIVAAKVAEDASRVVLTDHMDTVIDVLHRNVELNFPDQTVGKPEVAYLSWGSELEAFRQRYGLFDVIIGADVLFWPQACEPLFKTLDFLLNKKVDSRVVISYVRRNLYSENLMYSTAAKYGFQHVKVDLSQSKFHADFLEIQATQKGEIIIFSRMESL